MQHVGLIGCSISNLGSCAHAIQALGATSTVIQTPEDIRKCSHLILPGVGSFQFGMQHLTKHDLKAPLLEAVSNGKPILGICLGMQLFAKQSDEFGVNEGLKLLPFAVKKIKSHSNKIRLPHVGWNRVHHQEGAQLFQGIPQKSFFYFAHSYAYDMQPSHHLTSYTEYYQQPIITSVEQDNLFGVQFHPEKSQQAGLKLLENFLSLC